jgi:hypothetical protein
MLGDILRRGNGEEFEIAAAQLNERIAGAERMLAARRHGKSQSRIVRAHGLEIVAGEHQVVDRFHRRVFKALSRSRPAAAVGEFCVIAHVR